jgi:hypothetical protein
MKYYKNSELTLRYNISDKTVRNWIEASKQEKLGLKLYSQNNKTYIADSIENNFLLTQLAATGKKYRNNRNHKLLKPSKKFYELFSKDQAIEIINTLEKYHKFSWHHSYFGEGAEYWDKYLHELYNAGSRNLITNTIEALELNFAYLDAMIKPYKHVNIVNVCLGNNIAIRSSLDHIHKSGKLKRFIGIDISPSVLEVSDRNIQKWFKGAISMEKHVMDIRYDRFHDILAEDSYGDDASETINLIFFIAGPVANFQDPTALLKTLRESMNKNDLLFITDKRDTDAARGFFDFNIKSDAALLSFRHRMIPELLGIEESFYDAEQVFDERTNDRYVQIRLKMAVSLEFTLEKYKKTIELRRGDLLRVWTAHDAPDEESILLLNNAGFNVLLSSHSTDDELQLTISRLKPIERLKF